MKGMNFGKDTGSAFKQKSGRKTTIGGKIHSAIMTTGDVLTSPKPWTKFKNYKKYKQEHRNRKSQQFDGLYMSKGSGVSR